MKTGDKAGPIPLGFVVTARITFVLLLCLCPHGQAQAQYVLLNGVAESGIVQMWNMDGQGKLSVRSSFDIWTSATRFQDPYDVALSTKGNYLFVSEYNCEDGVVYRVDANYNVHLVMNLTSGCAGGGFTADEKYFITHTNQANAQQGPPRMNVFPLDVATTLPLFSETVATTAGLVGIYAVTSRGEVIESGGNGFLRARPSFTVYQFDEKQKNLALRQYIPDIVMYFCDTNTSEDLIAYTWSNTLGTAVRKLDGTWEIKPAWVSPTWHPYSWGGVGLHFTPDNKHVVVALSSNWSEENAGEGLCLFRVKDDKTLELTAYLRRSMLYAMAMTPDGKYVVAPYDGDQPTQKVGVFRVDTQNERLTEVYTTTRSGYLQGMAFLPQAFPPNSTDKTWGAYSEKTVPVGAKQATAKIAKAASLPDTPGPTPTRAALRYVVDRLH